jgi:hypothetical protein
MLLVEQPLPSSSEPQTIEEEIGCALRGAVGALANGILDHMAEGKLGSVARARGAEALAALYELRRDNPYIDDFEAVCRVHGKRALRAHLATQADPPKAPEARLDWLIDWVLKLHAEVVQKRVH